MKNKLLRTVASGLTLASLVLVEGCSYREHSQVSVEDSSPFSVEDSSPFSVGDHSPFSVRTSYDANNQTASLEVFDPAGVRKVEVYFGEKLIESRLISVRNAPSICSITAKLREDGFYILKIYDSIEEVHDGYLTKENEKVEPSFQACY